MLITVAGFGPSAEDVFGVGTFDGPRFTDHGAHLRWDLRTSTTVEVDGSVTIGEVLDRAALQLGLSTTTHEDDPVERPVSSAIAKVAFYRSSDDEPGREPAWMDHLPTVDDRGRLAWRHFRDARYSDVLRAADRGLAVGDFSRIYLYPMFSQGGGVGALWPLLHYNFQVFSDIVGPIAATYETSQLVRSFVRRLRRGVRAETEGLAARNVGLERLRELLLSDSWTADELVESLDITRESLDDLADFLGLEPAADGFRATDTLDVRLIAKLNHVFEHYLYEYRPSRDFQRFSEARLDALAREIEETAAEIASDWHASGAASLAASDSAEETREQPGVTSGERVEFRAVVISVDGGLDVAEFERQLSELVGEGFLPVHWLNDQSLNDGTRAHVLIAVRHLQSE